MEKILLDTDIGTDIDDTYALSYLLSHLDCILMGITTVSDDTVKRAYVADMLCRLFGKDIPILAGAPLRYTGEPTLSVFNRPHTYILDKFEHGEYKQDTLGAVNFLRDTILAHPHELTLLAIGPLMNVGLLFALYSRKGRQVVCRALLYRRHRGILPPLRRYFEESITIKAKERLLKTSLFVCVYARKRKLFGYLRHIYARAIGKSDTHSAG